MKTGTFLLTFILALFLSAVCSAQSSERVVITEPVRYNDYIVQQQDLIGNKLLDLFQVFNQPEATQSDALASLDLVKSAIEQAIANTSVLQPLDDNGLKQSAGDLFRFYQRTMQSKYPLLIEQVYSESPDQELIDRVLAEVTNEEKGYDEAFRNAQESFARANNFSLEVNELQQDFEGE